jgi:hypothetical protein
MIQVNTAIDTGPQSRLANDCAKEPQNATEREARVKARQRPQLGLERPKNDDLQRL